MTTTAPWSSARHFDQSAHLQRPVPPSQRDIGEETQSTRLDSSTFAPFSPLATRRHSLAGSVEHSQMWNTHKGVYGFLGTRLRVAHDAQVIEILFLPPSVA